ncbi:MAG: glycosyltransferase family 9 protein [Sphingobacteriales bacterium]|nr:glycosyltransferase family 9 protein [Sphingobacteriales bacterium]MBI3719579.1 glycosyltransferase family 9 protein [Sphingobacteriales bacterium]
MKILVIQTAFIGDVILGTAVVEKLAAFHPNAEIDFLVRKGNESLLQNNPHINEVLIWNKKENKLANLWKMIRKVRSNRYDYIFNLHRFATSGFITAFSRAKNKVGFDKNPLSFFFTKKIKHTIGNNYNNYLHEVDRNNLLIEPITDNKRVAPKLYPSDKDFEAVTKYQSAPYICMAPASVWFTKQWAKEKWIELLNNIDSSYIIYLLGAPGDTDVCNEIINASHNKNVQNLCGQLSFLQSAALMKGAVMNYVNDSAPMHIASAMDASVTAIYCSTVPYFGFGPLSSNSFIIETKESLDCKPCGLHGHKACPKGHFKCAYTIEIKDVLAVLSK